MIQVEPGSTWVDIGSHIGTAAIALVLRGAGKVLAFEPRAPTMAINQANCKLNKRLVGNKIAHFMMAVGINKKMREKTDVDLSHAPLSSAYDSTVIRGKRVAASSLAKQVA